MQSVLSLLDNEQINNLFPFYITLDKNLIIKSHGKGFLPITGNLEGEPFINFFSTESNQRFCFIGDLTPYVGRLLTINITNSNIKLSGQLIKPANNDTLIFFGAEKINATRFKRSAKNIPNGIPAGNRIHLKTEPVNDRKRLVSGVKPLRPLKNVVSFSGQNAIEEQLQSLMSAVNVSSDLIIITNAAGETEWVNHTFTKTTGYNIEDIKGKKPVAILQGNATSQAMINEMEQAILTEQDFKGTVLNYTKTGDAFWNELTIKPVKNADGLVVKYIWVSCDITERIKKTEELLYSELRWKFALSESGEGYFEYDIANGKFYGSDTLLSQMGLSNDVNDLDFQSLVGIIHPDDDEAAVSALFDLVSGKTNQLSHELRMKNSSGNYVWMMIRATITKKSADGKPLTFIGTTTDISQIKRTEQALLKAKKEAEKASEYKNQFLATMSHEIRTPLNAIIGLTNLMLLNKPTGELKENLKVLSFSSNHLLSLINDVLDLAKIEAGKIEFINAEFNLAETMNSVYQPFVTKCREKGVKISMQVDPSIPKILSGDPFRLTQILNNLVNNAVKFTSTGTINIHVKHTASTGNKARLMFEVADTGIGMSKKTQKKLFSDFVQANSGISQKFGGTGLGLSIIKKLIKLQGGQVRVESELNKGSRFYFELGFGVPEVKAEMGASVNLNKHPGNFIDHVKVLLVEDNSINQKVASSYLKRWNARVTCANNGVEALDMFRKGNFDIILMDLYMPVMNGFDAMKKIRKTQAGKKIPIVALTASADTQTIQKAIDNGANCCLGKPFDANHLLQTIYKLVNKNENMIAQPVVVANKPPVVTGFKYINLQRIEEASFGNVEFVKKMIELLKKEIPAGIEESMKDLENGNYSQFSQSIHKLKNSLLLIGFDNLKKDLTSLQENARQGKNLDKIPRLFSKTLDTWKRAEKELQTL